MNRSSSLPKMKRQTQFIVVLALLTALFALVGLGLYASPIQNPVKEPLLITGWLHVNDSTVQDVVLVVELEENYCTHSEILPNGRFYFEIPVDAKARLVFNKPGYLTKEVVIDTRNALNNKHATRVNSKVKFDLVLESTEITTGKYYSGPVGSITFVNGTGLMQVRHHEKLVALSKH
jgi:hypothetical protein